MDKNNDDIEGDGFIQNLFHFLWMKDPVLGFVPAVSVPDTIIFKFDEPTFWYFPYNDIIKRKSKANLTMANIERVFLTNEPACGIVATWVTKNVEMSEDKTVREHITYEYLNRAELKKFLYQKTMKPKEGILQRFIQPKGERNRKINSADLIKIVLIDIIRCIWSPKFTFYEKLENMNSINDTKQDTYQRVVTFESQKSNVRTVPVRGYMLPNKLEKITFNIVQHISAVTYDRMEVSRMILNFKLDEKGVIWFLFCSQLKLNEEIKKKFVLNSKIQPNECKNQIPHYIEEKKLFFPKPLNLRKHYKCFECETRLDKISVYKITYGQIIDGWSFDHHNERFPKYLMRENQGRFKEDLINLEENTDNLSFFEENTDRGQQKSPQNKENNNESKTQGIFQKSNKTVELKKNYQIPTIIKKLHPKMKDKEFNECLRNPGFLKKIALVCESCYLHIISSSSLNTNLKQIAKKHLLNKKDYFGTGPLDPEKIKKREEETIKNINSAGQDCLDRRSVTPSLTKTLTNFDLSPTHSKQSTHFTNLFHPDGHHKNKVNELIMYYQALISLNQSVRLTHDKKHEMEFPKKHAPSSSFVENYKPLNFKKENYSSSLSLRKASEPSTLMPSLLNTNVNFRRQRINLKTEDNLSEQKNYFTPSGDFFSTLDFSKEGRNSEIPDFSYEPLESEVELPKKNFLRKMLAAVGPSLRRSITGEAKKRVNKSEIALNSLMQAYTNQANRVKL